MNKKVLLMILDGWGESINPKVSAIAQAQTPFIDNCYIKYPHANLTTFGLAVGLPEGQMGNSEVGHMNIGAGRVVYQNLAKINLAIQDKTLGQNKELQAAFEYANQNHKDLHLIGLVSDGGVHSHINHLKALLDQTHAAKVKNCYIHAFTDGRDCDPKSGKKFIEDIINKASHVNARLASIVGRYYAMDRDNRWERVRLAYDVMTNAVGEKTEKPLEAIQKSYDNDVTDEFIKPIVCTNPDGSPVAKIKDGDVVIFFNFRTDRPRQITEALFLTAFPEQNMHPLDLYFVSMTKYDEAFDKVHVLYDEDKLTNTMGEVLAQNQKKQIRIAETEKYPHVTFFFSGGKEEAFNGESRILCPSPKDVATYDLKPEMSAFDIRDKIIPELNKKEADFICLNFANADMVGHTGVFEAAMKACEVVDQCAEAICNVALENDYAVAIIADHGNSDLMINEDGSPNTQHTTSPVPFFFLTKEDENIKLKNGKLGDLAPSILNYMGVEIPKEMNGNIIIEKI
ncbi:2,3-bisphosphoglycerate-independent phosphoglycerate mutase [Candidatus Ornithobacterium hominis]|uniref:2,3-bisphosphoglycerate-independent phosphoglycerate mutase n=1 Tax=Candidatus Ornithobacterium hominis TaxID=2497989 RepID=UPI000E5ADA1E|nr:2,3-bisphosphoglycerate-independent phosphoglycerate mutase [Candidatus Ornithobacterium hominis]SZD73701.1 2,3-bisphosphoglycerate-independent phosphoglycerate mutase [Candidatus Ornithobacterium hominis]